MRKIRIDEYDKEISAQNNLIAIYSVGLIALILSLYGVNTLALGSLLLKIIFTLVVGIPLTVGLKSAVVKKRNLKGKKEEYIKECINSVKSEIVKVESNNKTNNNINAIKPIDRSLEEENSYVKRRTK